MEYYMNENETVVFDDYDLKIVKQYSESDSSSSVTDYQSEVDYNNCCSLLRCLQEHFLYTESKFFDRLTFSDLEEYLGNIDEYEYFDEISFDNLGGSRMKPKTLHFWIMEYHDTLKESYAVLERIMRTKNMRNNTFYRFCLLGYNTSSSVSKSRLT